MDKLRSWGHDSTKEASHGLEDTLSRQSARGEKEEIPQWKPSTLLTSRHTRMSFSDQKKQTHTHTHSLSLFSQLHLIFNLPHRLRELRTHTHTFLLMPSTYIMREKNTHIHRPKPPLFHARKYLHMKVYTQRCTPLTPSQHEFTHKRALIYV